MTAFLALMRRDLHVALRGAGLMLFANMSQPVLVAMVFAWVFPRLHMVAATFDTLVLPGLIAVAILMNGVNGVLLPLSEDLAGNREIDERLLAPIGVFGVALQKIAVGTLTASVSGLVTLPVMVWMMRGVSEVHLVWPALAPAIVAASLVSAAFGLTLGALAGGRFSPFVFDVVVGPMLLFGCVYFPWQPLAVIGPARYLLLINPLVFMGEVLRAVVTPQLAHMPTALLLAGLGGFAVVLTAVGAWAFRRRTIL
jgi:ABC-2 type transport system permease protein